MKRSLGKKLIASVLGAALLATSAIPALAQEDAASAKGEYMNVGYAFTEGLTIEDLDLSKITHLNYSFGLIYNSEGNYYDEEKTDPINPDCQIPEDFDPALLHTIYLKPKVVEDLKKLPALKAKQNPDLKVMLSVGGWNARGFCDAAHTDEARKAFAKSCKEVIEEYDLAGIDLDWEYPTIDWASIKTCKDDPHDFTLLIKEIRKAIGDDKLLSIAGSANVNFTTKWTEFQEIVPLLDYINIMTYDFQSGTCYYGSALYASTKWPTESAGDEYNADMGIQRYIRMGCPPEKINMGLAYTGVTLPYALRDESWEIVRSNFKVAGITDEAGYYSEEFNALPYLKAIKEYMENKEYTDKDGNKIVFEKKWDADACMTYICTYAPEDVNHKKELFVLSYIEKDGLQAKIDYVKEWGLGGMMFWEYGSDYDNLLTTQIAEEFEGGRVPATKFCNVYDEDRQYMNVGYVFTEDLDEDWGIEDLDIAKITHLNYSFGLIYNNEGNYYDDEKTDPINPDCQIPENFDPSLLHTIYLKDKVKSDLTKLIDLKKEKNPDLNVMLSVGGWNARGFCDAAATDESRKAFANSCKQIIDEYQLAGIDLDWEYPTIDWASIKTSEDDPHNFTLLIKEIRQAIGDDKLLSIAGSANVNFTTKWTEFQEIVNLLDYINIMTYDFQSGSCYYGSALYASTKWPTESAGDEYNADMAIRRYIRMGCPPEKINMGLAYTGVTLPYALRDESWEIVRSNFKAAGITDEAGYYSEEFNALPYLKAIKEYMENKEYTDKDGNKIVFEKKWDADACMTYICTYAPEDVNHEKELFVLSYIEPEGLQAKIDYVKNWGLGGMMFWEFSTDYDNLLTNQIAKELNLKTPVIPNPDNPDSSTPSEKPPASSTTTPSSSQEPGKPSQTGDSMMPIALVSALLVASLGVFVVVRKQSVR